MHRKKPSAGSEGDSARISPAVTLASRIGLMTDGSLTCIRRAGELLQRCNDAEINSFLGIEDQ